MISRTELIKEIAQNFSKTYGSNLLSLQKCLEIKDLLETDICRIKAELDLTNSHSCIAQAVIETNKTVDKINSVATQITIAIDTVTTHLKETDEVKHKLEECIRQLTVLECVQQYVKIVQTIENLSDQLQQEIDNKDDEQCATVFANISEICRHLASTPGVHLRNYLKDVLFHWHNILKDKFAKDFEEALKAIKWPFVNVNVSLEVPLESNIRKLQIVVEYLLQIDLPEELAISSPTKVSLTEFPALSLPMELLVEPLRKRFIFHFYGSRKTNRVDKPEWYFTKVLSWIRDHSEFVEKWIQPVVDKMGLYQIDAKIELMRGLVQLSVEKLYSDLPSLQYDDFTFSHCIDEALGFDKELKESYGYPQTQPGVLNVLTQAQVFVKWLAMEKKYALEKMDVMLSESFTIVFRLSSEDDDDLKVTPCAEIFVTLLQTITERYEALPQPGHRLQFLELQLELLDDFRVRLLQLVHAEEGNVLNTKVPVIANTIFYIENVLVDWGAMLHFLNLHYYKSQLNNPETTDPKDSELDESPSLDIDSDTVFVDTLSLYRHMKKDLLCTLTEAVVIKAKNRSRSYRQEMWSKIKAPKEIRSLSLTPSACPMFEVLATDLYQLQKSLTSRLFTTVWQSIADQIDTFLYEEIVLENRFSPGGAMQFKYDITRNLHPLFSQYTEKPENYFPRVTEASSLLNLSKGSALLLRETLLALEGATGVEDRRGQALKEVGVQYFEPKEAISILKRRNDITVNRIASLD